MGRNHRKRLRRREVPCTFLLRPGKLGSRSQGVAQQYNTCLACTSPVSRLYWRERLKDGMVRDVLMRGLMGRDHQSALKERTSPHSKGPFIPKSLNLAGPDVIRSP